MKVKFKKYHALRNDFILIERDSLSISDNKFSKLAIEACDRKSGVGADGLILLSNMRNKSPMMEIVNADGSFAEISGNGLRISAYHQHLKSDKNKEFSFHVGENINNAKILRSSKDCAMIKSELSEPTFDTTLVPVKSKSKFMINADLKVGTVNFPVTCLSVGNPHTVLFVDDFNFEWQSLGEEIESLTLFPNRTNVEFVKIMTKSKIKVAVWERGAGATGSSGTGAAASVAAGVMNGQLNRECQVIFETGTLDVNWKSDDNIIELTGEVCFVCEGNLVV